MKKLLLVILLGLAVAVVTGCNKKDVASQPVQPGMVIATPAYERYFGDLGDNHYRSGPKGHKMSHNNM